MKPIIEDKKQVSFSTIHSRFLVKLEQNMNILSFPPSKNPLHISTTTTSLSSFNFKPPKNSSSRPPTFHARDRVIDFGKYKGKMLGALPSTYLKWVSNNLRARDFEEWAKLADEVLVDPIYKDRIEWEFAEKLLNGDVLTSPLSTKEGKYHSAVSELLELSERFGWDNDDKLGWSKIDFSILGTSKGGRIPRLDENGKNEFLMNTRKGKEVRGCNEEGGETRKERRERMRLRRSGGNSQNQLGGSMEKMGVEENDEGKIGNSEDFRVEGNQDVDGRGKVEIQRGFPGREGLLRKVLGRRR